MTISDLLTCSKGAKPNSELSLLLSSKISMKPQVKKMNMNAVKKNINWLTEQIKKTKNKVPIRKSYQLDLQWQANETFLESEPVLSEDKKSVCFQPTCFETFAVRANKPLKRNAFTYWEVTILNKVCSGSSLMIGVGTSKASLNSIGYLNLLGINQFSWGLEHTGKLWHDNQSKSFCDPFDKDGPITIGCLFNGYNGQLSYYKDEKCFGIAFSNLLEANDLLYPMVSSTVAQSVFRLDISYQSFPSLQALCQQQVLTHKLDCSQLPLTIINDLNRY